MPRCECCLEYSCLRHHFKALHSAASKGNLETVRFLIVEEKWDIEDVFGLNDDVENQTPLYLACQSGHLPVVQFFVEQGAKMNYHRNYHDYKNCQNPIVIAAENGHIEVVRYLVEKGAEMDYSCSDDVEESSQSSDNENSQNSDEENSQNSSNRIVRITPIMAASRGGQVEVIRFLLEQGVDRENGDPEGSTPLHYAAKYGRLHVMHYLLEQGADKEKANNDSETPLLLAAFGGRVEVVRVLVEHGAEKDKAGNDGETPLHKAACRGHLEVLRFLVEQGADKDKANNNGQTPLHLAARDGHLEIAKLLMAYGADLNARNNRGQLPIDVVWNSEAIKQAIRDEPRRRMDHGHKRATEQDRHPNAATSASAGQEEEGEEDVQSNKRPRLEEGVVEEGKVAEEDEDSEPSM